MRVPRADGSNALPGPPPVRHQPASITVTIASLGDGRLRISTPHARGWAQVARGPHQLATAIGRAFTEASCAGYAAWRHQRYDLDKLTAPDDPTEPPRRPLAGGGRSSGYRSAEVSWARGAAVRPDVAHPAGWQPNPDGSWTSPAGRRYTDQRTIAGVVRRRAALGLPVTAREAS